jgi:hypothetical protein
MSKPWASILVRDILKYYWDDEVEEALLSG